MNYEYIYGRLTNNENLILLMMVLRIVQVAVLLWTLILCTCMRQVSVDFYGKSKHDRYFYGAHRTMDAVDALRLFIGIL
ncbi:hypothetical protein [Veillonella nakazawae]|uniref:hypothetical protein n=1 Tax=Veillonella nakazawae TaxID=2682456 RepID=UPI003993362C